MQSPNIDRNAAIALARKAGETLQAIANTHRITRERVRQICRAVERRAARQQDIDQRWNSNTPPPIDPEALDEARVELEQITQRLDEIERKMTIAVDIGIDELELSARPYNLLKNMRIMTVGELTQCTPAQLLRRPNFGRVSLNEIQSCLADLGLSLRTYSK